MSVDLHAINKAEIGAYLRRSRSDYVNDSSPRACREPRPRREPTTSSARPLRTVWQRRVTTSVASSRSERTIGDVWYGPEADASDDPNHERICSDVAHKCVWIFTAPRRLVSGGVPRPATDSVAP